MSKWSYLACLLLAAGSVSLIFAVCGNAPDKELSLGQRVTANVLEVVMAVALIRIIVAGCHDLAGKKH